jgi:CheY-like chemotaxis protein
MASMSQALIIDDSADFRASARQLLEAEGYTVTEAATGAEGIRIAEELALELVLLDIQLPDLDGFEVAESLACLERPPEVVLTSTRDRADYGLLPSKSPARGFIPKSELSGGTIRLLLSGSTAQE